MEHLDFVIPERVNANKKTTTIFSGFLLLAFKALIASASCRLFFVFEPFDKPISSCSIHHSSSLSKSWQNTIMNCDSFHERVRSSSFFYFKAILMRKNIFFYFCSKTFLAVSNSMFELLLKKYTMNLRVHENIF